MNILVTNDDGFDAEGIITLFDYLSKKAQVFMLAPDKNRSGVSSILTMNSPLDFRKVGENQYSCSGYPVDCVIAALRSNIFPAKIDAVFSGINRGSNMGTDIIYSGTIAAARQAVLYGVPGIALSIESSYGEYEYSALAAFAAANLEKLISLSKKNIVVSINAPSLSSYKQVKFTSLCVREYQDKIEIADPALTGKDGIAKIIGHFSNTDILTYGSSDCEYFAVQQGAIAISRFFAEPVGFTNEDDNSMTFEL